jgi:hypothetical protein
MTTDSAVKKIERSPQTGVPEMIFGGGIAFVVIFSVGVFLMIVPILGWIAGPSLMIAAGLVAVWHISRILRRNPEYSGPCPYCGAPATAGGEGSVSRCGACKKRFLHEEGGFWKTPQ